MEILLAPEWTEKMRAYPASALVGRRTLTCGEMGFKIFREKFKRALDGRAGHGDEIAETFTFVKSDGFSKLLEDRLAALPLLNFLQQ